MCIASLIKLPTLPRGLFLCVLLASHLVALPCRAEDWPQFLGPNRTGIAAGDTKLVDAFPSSGPTVVWRMPAGLGMSGVVVSGHLCLTIARMDDQQTLLALDRKDGGEVWRAPLAPAYENAMGDGTRATPTVDDGVVYCFTGEGVLTAHELKNGKPLWARDLVSEFQTEPSEYGMASSPLVLDDRVIVQVGSDRASVVAVETKTGKTAWTAGKGRAGYSSPAFLTIAGEPQVVAFTGAGCVGLAPADGKQLWQYVFPTDYDCNTATPITMDGQVLISAGENHGSVLLNIQKQNETYSVSESWTSLGTRSGLRSEWQTPILLDGYLYGFDNVGSAGPVTNLVCLEAETGDVQWKKMRFGKSNGTAADGKLIIATMNGELVLVKATPKEFVELGRAPLIGKTRQAPAVADGFVYLRDDKEVVCVDLRAHY